MVFTMGNITIIISYRCSSRLLGKILLVHGSVMPGLACPLGLLSSDKMRLHGSSSAWSIGQKKVML